jgi:hypothetical protein
LLKPLRECAMWGANAQNGSNHRRMRTTPTRRRHWGQGRFRALGCGRSIAHVNSRLC